MSLKTVEFVAKKNIIGPERIVAAYPEGTSIAEMMTASDFTPPPGSNVACMVDDMVIDREQWARAKPREGQLVQVAIVPRGGNGQTAQILGSIAIIAATVVATAYGGPIAGAAVAGAGQLALNFLVQPPKPKKEKIADVSSVTGQQNQILRDGVVPKIYGRVRVTPPHGALPYTEVSGDDLYLRVLLVPGHGPLKISDIRVGDTPIGTLGTDFEVETREGRPGDAAITLYKNDIFEDNPAIEVTNADGPFIRRTQADTDEITIDFTWPDGVYRTDSKGKTKATFIEYNIEYRPVGTSVPYETIFIGNRDIINIKHRGTMRRTYRIKPNNVSPTKEYDVRVTRLTGDDNSGKPTTVNAFSWTALRSIKTTAALNDDTLAKIAIRIKRDGPVENINCICESYLPDYEPGVGWIERVTQNPASIYRDILTGDASARPLAIARVRESEDLEPWHQYCETEGFTCNVAFDTPGTLKERLDLVAAAGRASFALPDGRYGVIVDELKTTPVALYSPRNSANFQGVRDYVPALDAVRISFINEDNFQEDERIVYADGKDASNSDPGKIEFLDFRETGITDKNLVWRHGRFYLAQAALRKERWTLDVGLDNLVVTRGDLIRLQHDVLLIGLATGRVKSVTVDGSGDVTTATVDEVFTMESGNAYAVRARVIDSSDQPQIIFAPIDLDVGDQTTITFTTPIPASQALQAGDLISFGISGQETIEALVQGITSGPDLTATLSLVDAAPAIHTADTGTIPSFSSNITLPGDFFGTPPAAPIIDRVYLQAVNTPTQPDPVHSRGVVIVLERASAATQPPESYQVRVRLAGSTEFTQRHIFPGDSAQLVVPPLPVDNDYELQVRAIGRSPAGIPNESAWSSLQQISVPIPDDTTVDLPQIAGLELFNQASDTTYAGRDPTFVWRLTSGLGAFSFEGDAPIEAFSDPAIAFYDVRILNADDGKARRSKLVSVPEYTYSYEDNLEDAKTLNRRFGLANLPRRTFEVEVKVIDTFGREGPPSKLRVTNPSPAAPSGLQITPGIGTVFVRAITPADADFKGIKVWASTSSGFAPSDANEVASEDQSSVSFPAAGGVTLYVRAAFFDVFGSDLSELNISSEIRVDVPSVDAVPDFKFSGILFTPNDPVPDEVSWTAGEALTIINGAATADPVAAGSASFTGSPVYLYYTSGSGQIFDTTDPDQAANTDSRILAIYRGGTLLSQGNGDVIIDGSTIAAGTILAQQIAAGQITGDLLAGENLIVNSAQIGNLVVETSNIADLAINAVQTKQVAGFTPNPGLNAANAWRTVISDTKTYEAGSNVRLDFSFIADYEEFTLGGNGFRTIEVQIRILRNALIIKDAVRVTSLTVTETSIDDRARQLVSVTELDTPPAGQHTYFLQMSLLGTPISGNGLSAFDRNMIIQEIKK